MREAFALQKLLSAKASHIFSTKKICCIWNINIWNFNETLTNDVVSFEQPGHELHPSLPVKPVRS